MKNSRLRIIYAALFVLILITEVLIALFVIPTQVFDIIECCTFPEKAIFDYIKPYLNK